MKIKDIWALSQRFDPVPRRQQVRFWTLRKARQYFERLYVDLVMARYGGDRARVIKVLDISMSSLKEKLREGYGGR